MVILKLNNATDFSLATEVGSIFGPSERLAELPLVVSRYLIVYSVLNTAEVVGGHPL